MKITEQLERLQLQPREWAEHPSLQPIASSHALEKLIGTRNALVERRRELRPPVAPLDCRAALDLWRSCGGRIGELSGREIRALCRCPETGLLPELVGSVAAHDSAPKATLWFASLAATYFEHWRTMPNADQLEKALREYARKYAGKSSTLTKYREHAKIVFSPEAAILLADKAFENRSRLSRVLAEWSIPGCAGLASAVRENVIGRWIARWQLKQNALTEPSALEELRFLTGELLVDVTGAGFYKAVEAIVLSNVAAKVESVARFIRDYVLAHPKLGDPRSPQMQAGWTAMPSTVRQQVLRWLAKEWLIVFLETVLPSHEDDHGRKDFWLEYCGRIVDFNVALSRSGEARVRTHMPERPHYARLDHDTMSAFIMQFQGTHKDVIVVEFSQIGHAAYVHATPRFLEVNGSIHADRFRWREQLKHETKITRIPHVPRHDWQGKAVAQLAEYGIR